VLFVGNLARRDNSEGIAWFLRRCWPLVLERHPDARLIVAGADPPSWLRSDATTAVVVTGYVDDLDRYYRQARVVVVPLRAGAGLKFKVAHAMMRGLPVVSTVVGADGYDAGRAAGAFAAVTDVPAEFAAGVVAMLEDEAGNRTSGGRAARWARQEFNWEASVDGALAWYDELCSAARSSAQ